MSREHVRNWFEALPPEWYATAHALRELVLDTSPHISEHWKYKLPFYYGSSWLCYLSIQKKRLVLAFIHGNALSDPARLFMASGHKQIRHYLAPQDPIKLPITALQGLLDEALVVDAEIAMKRALKKRKRS